MLYYCVHLKFTLYSLPFYQQGSRLSVTGTLLMSEKSRLEQWKCIVIPEVYRRDSRKRVPTYSLPRTYPLVTELWYMLWPSLKRPEVRISACTL